jgi:hypothetical protein
MKTLFFPLLGLLVLGAFGIPKTAHAEIYKCVANGNTTYQQTPCGAGSTPLKKDGVIMDAAPLELVGCFLPARGPQGDGLVEIRNSGAGAFEMGTTRYTFGGGQLALKIATPAENNRLSELLHVRVTAGLSRKDPIRSESTRNALGQAEVNGLLTNMQMYGVFEGQETGGPTKVFLWFGGQAEPLQKTPCPH